LALGLCFFAIVDRILYFGAKHSQELGKLELENGRKAELLSLLIQYLLFNSPTFFYGNGFIRFSWQGSGYSGKNKEENKEMQRSGQSR